MPEKDWFSPREIRFTRRQVLWLIRNLNTLRDGHWPPEASNYIDIPIGERSTSKKAPFVTPVEYAAEILTRLEKAGIDGLILEAVECWDKSPDSMAAYFKVEEWVIARRKRRALAFVAGWRRKVR